MVLRTLKLGLVLAVLAFQIVLAQARPPVNYSQLVGYIKSGQTAQLKHGLEGRTHDQINLSGRSILMVTAIESSQPDAIDALLDWGMDVNRSLVLAQQGVALEITPLLHAVSAKTGPGLVRHLITRGANVNKASEGLLPFNFALSTQQFDVAMLLLDNGARISAVDDLAGMTPLMELSISARGADDRVLPVLAKRIAAAGGNVNAQNNRGGTALIFAVTSGNPTMVRTLLELGANPNTKNEKGDSPLAIALRRQREDLAGLLRQFGAQP